MLSYDIILDMYSLYVIAITRIKMKSFGIFQGPLMLQGLAAHLKATHIAGEQTDPNVFPVGALAIVATAVSQDLSH